MKVLHLLSSNRFSGAENVVCQIIGLFKTDDDIEMAYVSPDGPIRDEMNNREIRYIPISGVSVSEVRRVIRQEMPDVLYAHDMRASTIAAIACGRTNLISHIHNNAFDSRKITVKSLAYLLAVHKAQHIFWVSQNAFDGYRFRNKCYSKSSVLYNVVDMDALKEKMHSDSTCYNYDVVYVGRLSYPKNPQRLLWIIKLLLRKKQDIRVAVVGNGELEEEIKALSKEYGLQDNVDFLGFKSNPLKILHDSKVMVMTSRWEGTPMCALEAMALGVPIVSTPTDGLQALVKHGETGFLSNDDDVLAEHIATLIQNEHLRKEMSQKTLEVAKYVNDKTSYKEKIRSVLMKCSQ